VEPGNYESWAFFFQVDVFCVEWDVNSSTQWISLLMATNCVDAPDHQMKKSRRRRSD